MYFPSFLFHCKYKAKAIHKDHLLKHSEPTFLYIFTTNQTENSDYQYFQSQTEPMISNSPPFKPNQKNKQNPETKTHNHTK